MRWTVILALALAGCAADSLQKGNNRDRSNRGDDDAIAAECAAKGPEVAESRIRRLTPAQYQNTVRDLFGDQAISLDLHDDVDIIPSAITIEKYVEAASVLGERGLGLLGQVPNCAKDDACASAFVDKVATRAFRRPLRDDERTWLNDTYKGLRAKFTFEESIIVLTQVLLASPQFLYLSNDATPVPNSPSTLRRLDDYALASRLSYFLWSSMPDDELLKAASEGRLSADDREGLREQASRMLDSPRAREMAHDFVNEWFELDGGKLHFGLEEAPKDPELYPTATPELRRAMLREIGALMEKVAFDGGSVTDLFTSTDAYVNGPLATLYGVPDGPASAADWRWVKLNPAQRAGLLTRAAFAAVYASDKVQSPIRRGTFVLRNILCYNQAPPPPNVDNRAIEDLEANGAPKTIRQATSIRTSAATCQGCHSVIDPIGFAFEHYDAMGGYRDKEARSQLPIDASGVLTKSGSTDGPVADAVAMSAALAKSEVAAECLSKQWFKHAIRRDPDLADQCSFATIKSAVGPSHTMRDLLLAIVTSDAFLFSNSGAP